MIDPAQPVWVYRNLHRRTYSLMQKGIVRDHEDTIILRDARFIVRQGGYRRYHANGCRSKNVHAFVVGYVTDSLPAANGLLARYNPREQPCFRLTANGQRIDRADTVCLSDNGIMVYGWSLTGTK